MDGKTMSTLCPLRMSAVELIVTTMSTTTYSNMSQIWRMTLDNGRLIIIIACLPECNGFVGERRWRSRITSIA
jgi:hypothetical protein